MTENGEQYSALDPEAYAWVHATAFVTAVTTHQLVRGREMTAAERILTAARQLMLEHGLRRTSLADIAQAAEVANATLYRRFPTRDALLETLIAREARAFIAQVDEQITNVDNPEDRLVTAFLMLTRALREHDLVQRLLITTANAYYRYSQPTAPPHWRPESNTSSPKTTQPRTPERR